MAVELIALGTVLNQIREQALVEGPLGVNQFVTPHQPVLELHLDSPQKIGGYHLETGAGVDSRIDAPGLLQIPVALEAHRVGGILPVVAGVGDPIRVELHTDHPAAPVSGAAVGHPIVAVIDAVALAVFPAPQGPAEHRTPG